MKLSSLKKKAWRIFSLWVRSSVANFQGYSQCYTCGRSFPWQEMNAGHYRHDSHDYDECNVKCQCVGCNLSDKGRADEFYLHLIKDYGKKIADEIRTRPKWNNYSTIQLLEIIELYQTKLELLEKSKRPASVVVS